jgi:hypothetical protein
MDFQAEDYLELFLFSVDPEKGWGYSEEKTNVKHFSRICAMG